MAAAATAFYPNGIHTSLTDAPRFLDHLIIALDTEVMATETKQTWDEMKKMYPDQWLEIVDFETGKYDEIVRGVVVAHGSVSDFPPPPLDRGAIALRYTGESTYRM